MTRASSLQMISIGLLCIFSDHQSCGRRCFDQKGLESRTARFLNRSARWGEQRPGGMEMEPQSCANFTAQTWSQDHSHRSLSPWRYRIDKQENRIPQEIAIAECLCQGCIIKGREEKGYNSVPVYGKLRILKKTRCPTDPHQYVIEDFTVQIPVACTCVVPETSKG